MVSDVQTQPRQSVLRAVLRVIGLILLSLILILPIFAAWRSGVQRLHYRLLMLYHTMVCRMLNIRITVHGEPAHHRPLMWVSNHFSYLDVHVLGALLPICFTPKSEIAGWPVIGTFAKLSGCIFIDRRKSKTKDNQVHLIEKMREGHAISLFPEGTTNDGTKLLPFKSSYFSLADESFGEDRLMIQPISIVYTRLQGEPLRANRFEYVGWYGDMDFFPHFWRVLCFEGIEVDVCYLPLFDPSGIGDRKLLASMAQQKVEEAIATTLHAYHLA